MKYFHIVFSVAEPELGPQAAATYLFLEPEPHQNVTLWILHYIIQRKGFGAASFCLPGAGAGCGAASTYAASQH
jgi:hypothetical protein